jgi:hypothetical protein
VIPLKEVIWCSAGPLVTLTPFRGVLVDPGGGVALVHPAIDDADAITGSI